MLSHSRLARCLLSRRSISRQPYMLQDLPLPLLLLVRVRLHRIRLEESVVFGQLRPRRLSDRLRPQLLLLGLRRV